MAHAARPGRLQQCSSERRPVRPAPAPRRASRQRRQQQQPSSQPLHRCSAAVNNADLHLWGTSAWTFPTYLQQLAVDESSLTPAALPPPYGEQDGDGGMHPLWLAIRHEAQREAASEPLLSSFLYATILEHRSFEHSLAFVLANRLANSTLLPSQLFDVFCEVLSSEPDVIEGALADIQACHDRDPACTSFCTALLYYKGLHSLQTHRIAHALWRRGQRLFALALQSRHSEVFGVDIHPAARIGAGVFMDHACGVVIGETAVIGNNVTIMQDVTLGGTGKDMGDRHPKIGDNVLIGASAKVLGNITIGRGALIAPGSLVLKPVEEFTMVAGAPAQPVGKRPMSTGSLDS